MQNIIEFLKKHQTKLLILLVVMIICYYINRYIVKDINKTDYSWEEVKTNLLMSIFFPISFLYRLMISNGANNKNKPYFNRLFRVLKSWHKLCIS